MDGTYARHLNCDDSICQGNNYTNEWEYVVNRIERGNTHRTKSQNKWNLIRNLKAHGFVGIQARRLTITIQSVNDWRRISSP